MKKSIALLAALAAFSAPVAAQQVTTITPQWTNDNPDNGVIRDNSPPSDIRVCWTDYDSGCSDSELERISAYRFVRATTPITPTMGTAFSLGTFFHYNNPISLSAPILRSVDLELAMVIGGQNVNGSWRFSHTETPNTGNGCCNDLITISNLNVAPVNFVFSGMQYNFSILGFGDTPLQAPNNSFSTREDRVNQTKLWAVVNQVPEPTSMALIGTGLIGLAGAARRRRQA